MKRTITQSFWGRASMTFAVLFCCLCGASAQNDGPKTLPYSYSFDNKYWGANTLPARMEAEGWNYVCAAANVEIFDTDDFTFSSFTHEPQYVVSPQLDGGNKKVIMTFKYVAGTENVSFKVGYSMNSNDPTSDDFTWSEVVVYSAGSRMEYEDVLPIGTKYVAINYTKPGVGYAPLTIDDFYFKPRAGLYGVYLNAVNNNIKTSARWASYFGQKTVGSLLSANTYVWEYVPGEDAEELANKMMGTDNACEALVLPMPLPEPYTFTYDVETNFVYYTKELKGRTNKYQAWLLPFQHTITAEEAEKFNFYKINMVANAPSPSVDASDEVWVFLKKMKEGDVLRANMPYVYKPLVDMDFYVFNEATPYLFLEALNPDVLLKTETAEDVYSFYATYDNTTATAEEPFYYVGIDGNLSYGDNVTVGPYRWIIRKTSKFNSTVNYSRVIHFYDGEDMAPTGISDLTEQADENVWYTISGVRLEGQPTEPGLYIVNGKKVTIK